MVYCLIFNNNINNDYSCLFGVTGVHMKKVIPSNMECHRIMYIWSIVIYTVKASDESISSLQTEGIVG